jgi:hypothetical protein
MECPEIFQHGERRDGNVLDGLYGNCPILLNNDDPLTPSQNIDMRDYIQALQRQATPSMNHLLEFTTAEHTTQLLAPDHLQKLLHRELGNNEFDFSRFPFKLQKWDTETERWCLLTIDCQLTAAAFLVYLNKNLAGVFVDRVHTRQILKFDHKEVNHTGTSNLNYIEVTPVLREPLQPDVYLRLTLTDEVSFPSLKFTVPVVMATAPHAFECCICFEGMAEGEEDQKISKTGCGMGAGHCFHSLCINGWFRTGNSSCPVCRTTIAKHA